MNAKQLYCVLTMAAMVVTGMPLTSFAMTDQPSQLTQAELQLVFQMPENNIDSNADSLVYLDEKEMKETEGKYFWLAGMVVGGLAGGPVFESMGLDPGLGHAVGAVGGLYGGLLAPLTGLGLAGQSFATLGLTAQGSFTAYTLADMMGFNTLNDLWNFIDPWAVDRR